MFILDQPLNTMMDIINFIGQLLYAGQLFTFVIMFFDKRVRPNNKNWWFMETYKGV